ncbi:MAG: helix-turn-helix transcriptional regulator [Candidatus Riflebacteria bacterium]|nr:helix-turn-helix transcriptional regulator [Candidatus Riflebacteria bacterium]
MATFTLHTPAQALRLFMSRKGMNQAALSRATEIPDSIISRLLKGRTIGPAPMEKICRALKLTEEESADLKNLMIVLRAKSRYEKVLGELGKGHGSYILKPLDFAEAMWNHVEVVVKMVEEACQRNGLRVSPEKKAEIVVEFAKDVVKNGPSKDLGRALLKALVNAE